MSKRVVKLKSLKPVNRIKWSEKQIAMKDDIINNYDYKKGI